MKYKIIKFVAPQVLVTFSTDDDQYSQTMWVRIDPKEDKTIPTGEELDRYILSYAPQLPPVDPYEGVNWGPIEQLVQPTDVIDNNAPKIIIL